MTRKSNNHGERLASIETTLKSFVPELKEFMKGGIAYREENTKETALIKSNIVDIKDNMKSLTERVDDHDDDIKFVKRASGLGAAAFAMVFTALEYFKK